jgi:hypothetical protein
MTEVPSIGFSRGSPTEQFPYVGFTIDISRTESKFTFSVEKGEQGENNQQRNAKSEKTKKSGKGNQADTDDKPATPTAPTRWSTNLERVISNCRTAFLAMTKSFTFPELEQMSRTGLPWQSLEEIISRGTSTTRSLQFVCICIGTKHHTSLVTPGEIIHLLGRQSRWVLFCQIFN